MQVAPPYRDVGCSLPCAAALWYFWLSLLSISLNASSFVGGSGFGPGGARGLARTYLHVAPAKLGASGVHVSLPAYSGSGKWNMSPRAPLPYTWYTIFGAPAEEWYLSYTERGVVHLRDVRDTVSVSVIVYDFSRKLLLCLFL